MEKTNKVWPYIRTIKSDFSYPLHNAVNDISLAAFCNRTIRHESHSTGSRQIKSDLEKTIKSDLEKTIKSGFEKTNKV